MLSGQKTAHAIPPAGFWVGFPLAPTSLLGFFIAEPKRKPTSPLAELCSSQITILPFSIGFHADPLTCRLADPPAR
jgi:hypothetical protein